MQLEEQLAYFEMEADSLQDALQGSLLVPFAECLSDCTFIQQERASYF